MAECTRLIPEGGYSGKCKRFLRPTPEARTQRTLKDLEWFGPPERNTLRPLRVVLLLSLWMSLSSASQSLYGLSPSLTGVSLLESKEDAYTGVGPRHVDPTRMYSILPKSH